jgi:hypothetical protein
MPLGRAWLDTLCRKPPKPQVHLAAIVGFGGRQDVGVGYPAVDDFGELEGGSPGLACCVCLDTRLSVVAGVAEGLQVGKVEPCTALVYWHYVIDHLSEGGDTSSGAFLTEG